VQLIARFKNNVYTESVTPYTIRIRQLRSPAYLQWSNCRPWQDDARPT